MSAPGPVQVPADAPERGATAVQAVLPTAQRDGQPPAAPRGDWLAPHPLPPGSDGLRPSWLVGALGRTLLRLWGWHLLFDGLPAKQGVFVVYPHTSNWDFPVGLFTKWALGLQVKFWGKDALFKNPLVGRWMRWVGGIPVDRSSAHGMVGSAVAAFNQAKAQGDWFWLALAPEGTRRHTPGWRSGFYHVAVQADVPVCLVWFDWARRQVRITDFIRLSGDRNADFARMAAFFDGVTGHTPQNMSPIVPLDAKAQRTD